jgi:hypothetical protein
MREGARICVSLVAITCPLWAPSHLSSLLLILSLKKSLYLNDYKKQRRNFWLFESNIGEGLDASIFFIIGTSYLNSNRICHLSLNCRQCGINPFEQPFGIICRIFICHQICLRCFDCFQFQFRRKACDHTFHVQSCVSIVLVEHSIKDCFSVFTYGFSNSIYVTILHELYYQSNRY